MALEAPSIKVIEYTRSRQTKWFVCVPNKLFFCAPKLELIHVFWARIVNRRKKDPMKIFLFLLIFSSISDSVRVYKNCKNCKKVLVRKRKY